MQFKHLASLLLIFLLTVFYSCDLITEPGLPEQPEQTQYTSSGEPIESQYIIAVETEDLQPDSGTTPVDEILNRIDSILQDFGIENENLLNRYLYSFKGFTAILDESQLQGLEQDDRVSYIEQDRTIGLIPPVDDLLDNLIEGNTDQSTPYGISRVGGPFDGTGLTTWVIDTGVDQNHNDLLVDQQRSISFVLPEPMADDLHGHGTHVAGTIAAVDNDIDVVGVAAGANVVGVKVLNALGIGSTSWVIAGIDYVAEHATPGEVANLSLGGSPSDALDDAVRNASDVGILFAVAAGNDSEHAGNYSPARVEHEYLWTVSAVDENDIFATFSNYGNPPVRFAAPGVNVQSLWINNSTNTISGTSMAAPHVAGILLVSEGNPDSDGTAIDDPDENPDPIIYYITE